MTATVISSSMCRGFEPCARLTTQVFPGCTTARLLNKIRRAASHTGRPRRGDVDLSYSRIIIYIGGNDVSDGVPVQSIILNILAILMVLHGARPGARIAVSGLLPRPREPELAVKIREVNRILKRLLGHCFIPAQRRFLRRQSPRLDLYTRNGVHLNRDGSRMLQQCYLNAAIFM